MYSVLLVSSFRLVREGIRAVIEHHDDFKVVGEAGDRSHTLQLIGNARPDVILFDLDTEYAAAIQTIREIIKDRPGIKIIALSTRGEDAIIESVLRAGVRAFVLKTEPSDLVEVLKIVARGGAYVGSDTAARLIDWVRNRALKSRPNPALDVLTERELDVLRLLAEGSTSNEVASTLNLSVETIRSYRKSLMFKVKIHNLAGLVQFAASAGLMITPETKGREPEPSAVRKEPSPELISLEESSYAPRILVVDDQPDVRDSFERVLSEVGYFVTPVRTARHAPDVLRNREFELVVLDLSLPGSLDTIASIHSEFPHVRILATSESMAGDMPNTALAAGAAAILEKPVAPHKFLDFVYRLLAPSGAWMAPAAR